MAEQDHRLPGMSVDQSLWTALITLSQEVGQTRTDLIREAIRHYVLDQPTAEDRARQAREHAALCQEIKRRERELRAAKERLRAQQRVIKRAYAALTVAVQPKRAPNSQQAA